MLLTCFTASIHGTEIVLYSTQVSRGKKNSGEEIDKQPRSCSSVGQLCQLETTWSIVNAYLCLHLCTVMKGIRAKLHYMCFT